MSPSRQFILQNSYSCLHSKILFKIPDPVCDLINDKIEWFVVNETFNPSKKNYRNSLKTFQHNLYSCLCPTVVKIPF